METAAARTTAFSSITLLNINLIYLDGDDVDTPAVPIKCKICTINSLNSQSSMNSHKCKRDVSLVSGIVAINSTILSTILFLNSTPPSSLKNAAKKFTIDLCFAGYFMHNSRIALTTTILNSSPISVINDEICFINLSIELSFPVIKKIKIKIEIKIKIKIKMSINIAIKIVIKIVSVIVIRTVIIITIKIVIVTIKNDNNKHNDSNNNTVLNTYF